MRSAAFNHYIADPYDGAAPAAVVECARKPEARRVAVARIDGAFARVMSHTHTGPQRLKGGLRTGWTLNHKTGTGQELGGTQAGYNDIGILTAPDGKSYAVAVMIKKTSVPLPVRMALMSNVTRAVIKQHDCNAGSAYASGRR